MNHHFRCQLENTFIITVLYLPKNRDKITLETIKEPLIVYSYNTTL